MKNIQNLLSKRIYMFILGYPKVITCVPSQEEEEEYYATYTASFSDQISPAIIHASYTGQVSMNQKKVNTIFVIEDPVQQEGLSLLKDTLFISMVNNPDLITFIFSSGIARNLISQKFNDVDEGGFVLPHIKENETEHKNKFFIHLFLQPDLFYRERYEPIYTATQAA